MKAKIKELRALADGELRQRTSDATDELFRLRVRRASERIENTAQFKQLRRDIARHRTLLRERESAAAAKAPAAKK